MAHTPPALLCPPSLQVSLLQTPGAYTQFQTCGAAWEGKETRKIDWKNIKGRFGSGGARNRACPEPVDLSNLLTANSGFSHI